MDSSKPQQSAPEVVRITVESVSVKDSPKKFGVIVCQIQEGVFVVVHEKRKAAEILWLRIDCGWIVSHGLDGRECYEPATMEQATRSWELEKSRRHRMAAAVAAMLVKSYTLANVKRFVRSIVRHTDLNYPEKPLVMLSDSSIEQIMISLGGEYGLKKQKVFEYIKVSATQQSNPPKSLVDIVEEIERIVSLRPTLWVKNNLNVLETEEMKVLNDKFVMAAAGGNTELFDWYLSRGQELTILHSELKYTALHAAADFGQPEIIARIISTGLSLDLKEPRKGQTALHCAAQSGRIEVLLQLRDAGADRRIMDNFGYKPYEIAHAQGYIDCREVVKLLTPKIRSVKVTDTTISSISFEWDPPLINETCHSAIIEYMAECVPVEGDLPIYHTTQVVMTQPKAHFSSLYPSTVYRLSVKTRSLAGWSAYGNAFLHKTLSSVPEPPPKLEILKVTMNSLLAHWHPPYRNNGHPVNLYQLEVLDYKLAKAREDPTTLPYDPDSSNRGGVNIWINPSTTENDEVLPTRNLGNDASQSTQSAHGAIENDSYESPISRMIRSSHSRSRNRSRKNTPLLSEDSVSNQSILSAESEAVGHSMRHRLIRHRNIDYKFKFITGLEPFNKYLLRVRCQNENGFSPWSEWTGPIAPQPGVNIVEYSSENLSAKLNWFQPLLSCDRKVELYELQVCNLKGPMQRSIVVGHHMKVTRAIKQAEAQGKFLPIAETNTSSQESHDWVTISSTIEAPPFEIVDLKAGLKYQCRVRHRIAGENWIEWDKCVFSDIFSMAATAPEPPFEVRAAFIDKISDPLQHAQSSAAELEVNSHVGDIINDTDSLQHESTNTAVKAENLISNQQESNHIEIPASLILADPDTFEDCYDLFKDNIDVTHDSIVITWKNGVTNGMPIVEHEIECARVRNHYINEVEAARDAFYNEEKEETIPRLNSGSFSPHIARYGVRSPASPLIPFANTNLVAYDPNEFEVRHSPLSPKRLAKGDEERIVLRWQNITHEGEFINAQAFRAKGLVPGSSYVFRVRQRNEKGWSKFSQSSKLIPTFPTAPPSAPTVLSESSGSTYLTVSWYQEKDSGVALTVLGYEVQTGKNEPSGQQLHMKSDASGISDLVSANEMLNWETATTKEVKGQADGSIVVMVEHLTPSTHYCVRVRIRTVAGWSPWSSHSNVWKTQGQ